MKALEEIIDDMTPDDAMILISKIVKRLFAYADENARMALLYSLVGDADNQTGSGLVHR